MIKSLIRDEYGNGLRIFLSKNNKKYIQAKLKDDAEWKTIGLYEILEDNTNVFIRNEDKPFNLYGKGNTFNVNKLLFDLKNEFNEVLFKDNDIVIFNNKYKITKKEIIEKGLLKKFGKYEYKYYIYEKYFLNLEKEDEIKEKEFNVNEIFLDNKKEKKIIKLAEKPYFSFQGEGITCGKNSLIVRFFACSAKCVQCDSKFTWDNYIEFDYEELNKMIEKTNNIIFTGGEPLLKNSLKEIIKIIIDYPDKNYEIETNGIIKLENEYYDFFINKKNILFNISPKGNFKQEKNIDTEPNLLNYTNLNYIVKFLFDSNKDFEYIKKISEKYKIPNNKIYVQPKAINENDIIFLTKKYFNVIIQNNYNFSFRAHILIFGNKRGV